MRKFFGVSSNTLGLRYCESDQRSLETLFLRQNYDVATHNRTKSGILQAFEEMIEESAFTDSIVFYLSGHAFIDKGKLWLLLDDDSSKLSNKVDVTYMSSTLSECRASTKLVILDCCHASAGAINLALPAAEQYLIIASSGMLQKSVEMDELASSFFSYAICSTIRKCSLNKNGAEGLTANNLYASIKSITLEHNGRCEQQVPVPRIFGTHGDFILMDSDVVHGTDAAEKAIEVFERNYCELLLRNCDIISLANLPELDRHLAVRTFELRRLYAPLRAWVDLNVGETPDDDAWQRMEARRKIENGHYDLKFPRTPQRQREAIGACLSRSRRLVILGDPGSGKTTLLRWLATAFLLKRKNDAGWRELPDILTLPDFDLVPILVRCRDLDNSALAGTLDDILGQTLRKDEHDPGKVSELLAQLRLRMKNGNALLLLDGLDEITDTAQRARFCEQLERIQLAYPDAPIVITSRIVGYREMGYRFGTKFEHLVLADLEPQEKDDFAVRWCKLTEPSSRAQAAARDLIHDIHSNNRIERMTGNPMLLTTMALVKRKVGKLPSRRADLYSEGVQVLLNWRSTIGEPLDAQEAIPQLEYVAYAMCDRGVQRLRRSELLQLIAEMRVEYPNIHVARNHTPEEFLRLLERRTGLIVEAGRERFLGFEELVYEFRHLTFQEFLAAHALVDGKYAGRIAGRSVAQQISPLAGRTEEISVRRFNEKESGVDENWREVLRLALTICRDDDVDDILHAICAPLLGETDATKRSRAVLAVLSIADEPNASEATVAEVFECFCTCIDSRDRNMSVHTGVQIATEAIATTRWMPLLADILIRRFCILPAECRDYTGDVAALLFAKAARPRGEKLKQIPDYHINDLISNIPEKRVRATLAITGILAVNEIDEFPSAAIRVFLQMLDEFPPMQHSAAQALQHLYLEDIFWWPQEDELKLFVNLVSSTSFDSEGARFLLEIINDELGYEDPTIGAHWRCSGNSDLRDQVIRRLAASESPAALEWLLELVSDELDEVRLSVASGIGKFKDSRVYIAVCSLLEDRNEKVREAAVLSVSTSGDLRFVPVLLKLIPTASDPLKVEIAYAFGSLARLEQPDEVYGALLELLSNNSADVRAAAVHSLTKFGSSGHALINHLSAETDDEVIISILHAVDKLKPKGYVEVICQYLVSEKPELVLPTIDLINGIGDQAVLPYLEKFVVSRSVVNSEIPLKRLCELDRERGLYHVASYLNGANINCTAVALRVVGLLKLAEFEDVVVQLVENSPANNVIVELLAAVADLSLEKCGNWVISQLINESIAIRRAAIKAAGELKLTDALPVVSNLDNAADDAEFELLATSYVQIAGIHKLSEVQQYFAHRKGDRRRASVAAVSKFLDESDRKLLSRDFDGRYPFLDPKRLISRRRTKDASRILAQSEDEIKKAYGRIFGAVIG